MNGSIAALRQFIRIMDGVIGGDDWGRLTWTTEVCGQCGAFWLPGEQRPCDSSRTHYCQDARQLARLLAVVAEKTKGCPTPLCTTGQTDLRDTDAESTEPTVPVALAHQAGGDHYRSCPLQPIQYIQANGLGFIEGNVIKYVTRHRAKGGRQDIDKAIHYLQLLLELEYRKQENTTT